MKWKLFGTLLLMKMFFFPPLASCQSGSVVILQPPSIVWTTTTYKVGSGAVTTNSPTIDLAVSPVPVLTMTISATGGVPPLTYSIKSGAAPPGLTLNSASGVFSGTPTARVTGDGGTCTAAGSRTSCSYTVTLQVTDSLGTTATRIIKWETLVATIQP